MLTTLLLATDAGGDPSMQVIGSVALVLAGGLIGLLSQLIGANKQAQRERLTQKRTAYAEFGTDAAIAIDARLNHLHAIDRSDRRQQPPLADSTIDKIMEQLAQSRISLHRRRCYLLMISESDAERADIESAFELAMKAEPDEKALQGAVSLSPYIQACRKAHETLSNWIVAKGRELGR